MGTIAQKVQWTWDCKRDIEQALLERGIALPQDFRDFGDAIRSIGRKPYDSEVEYLESDGTPYINTGYLPTDNTEIEVRAALTQSVQNAPAFFGSRTARNGTNGVVSWWDSDEFWCYAPGNGNSSETKVSMSFPVGTQFIFKYAGDGIYVNGIKKTTYRTKTPLTNQLPLWIFAINNGGVHYNPRVPCRIYNFRIYESGVLVRDFIPVRKNGVGYLYDKVSGKLFGNAGTGAFLYGDDVREVEYIESTGTQYIDTGITGGSTSKIELVAASQNNSEYQALVGARGGTLLSFSIWQYSGSDQMTGPRFDYIASTVGSNPNIVGGTWNTSGLNTVVKDGRYNYLNGVQLSSNSEATFSCPCPFTLFAINNNGSPVFPAKCKMYSCRIYDSGVLVRDFIPYRIGNKGCLFDKVSGKFFTNAGTGDFTTGPDALNQTTTSKAVYDAKVEYIESTGTQFIDTGIIPDGKGTSVECVFSNSVNGNFSPVLWTRGENATDRAFCFEVEQRQQARWDYADYGAMQMANTVPLDERTTLTIKDGTATVNGIQLTRASKEFTGAGPMILCNFCNYVNGVRQMISANVNPVRIYSCKVFSDGLLVRDFIPVRKDGRGCLCDLVTGRLFENAGTGVFKYGEDVVYLPADTEMIYDAEVEYLESTGTQYIDTETDAAVDVDMSIDAVSLNTGSTQFHAMGVFTTSSNSGYALFCSNTGMITGSVGNDVRVRANGINWNTRRLVELKNGELIVGGTSYGLPSPMPTSLLPGNHIWLMGLNGIGVSLPIHPGRCYGAKIYKNNVLVRDFQPVRKNGVGYLFDRVGRKLYGSAGTGAFKFGGDK